MTGMKPLVADKHPCYEVYIKTNIYLIIIILYNSSIKDIGHFPMYIPFGLLLTNKRDSDNYILYIYIYIYEDH